MFEVFANERAVNEFVAKDRNFAQKVLDHIKGIIKDIKSIYNQLISTGKYEDMAAWKEDLEALQKVNDMMLDALSNIEQRIKSKQKAEKNTSDEVVNATKRTFSYKELTSKPDMKLTALSESVPTDANGKINRGVLVDKAIQNVKTIGYTNKNENGEVFVKDVGRNVAISKASIRHGIDRRIETQAPVLMHIGEVISNSIEINRLTPKKNTASGSYILLGAAKDGNNIYVVSSVVNRYTNYIDSIDVLYSANIKRESAVSKTRASGKSLQSLTDSTISVSDLLEIVKDKNPEILSNDVLKHFGLTRGNGEIESALMFSTKRLIEETKDLIAVHNLSYDKITDALKLGGLPMPSIAVLKAKQGHNKYGEISVVFNKNTISPEIDSRNKVYVADAYSPTFPNVRIKANKEKAQRLANVLKTSVAGVESNIIDRNENEIVRKAASQHQLQRKYVEDNGIKVDGNKEPKFTNSFHKRMTDFIVENDITWEKLINDKKLQDEYIQKVTESTPSFRREKAVSEIKAIFENDFLIHNDAIINSFNTDFEIAKGNVKPSFDEWTYLHNIREYLTDNSNPYGYNEGYIDFVKGYTDGIVDKTEIYTGEDTFLESGEENPNAYKDYTAENVVDVMKSQKHQNGGGIGYLRALLGQQFENIEDIRSNKDRLVTEAEFNEKADKLNDKFTEIASMGAEFNKGVGLWNITHDTFVQAIENGATRQAMIDALNDNGFRWVKGDFVDKCMEFIEELKATPTEYFEAKPERVVEFNEIAFVVIPDNAPAKLVNTLNERGIKTRTYTAGDEADRVRALNSDESVLFSTKRAETIAKNPNELTENDVKSFMKEAIKGNLHEGTYFPVRRNTPRILVESASEKNGDVIENLPIIIQVKKAISHGISPDDMVSIVKAMDDPQYIIYQEENDRYVEVVKYDTTKGSKAVAVLEIGGNKDAPYLNGYKGGSYHTLVTAFNPDVGYVSDTLLKNKNNVVIYKKKGDSQRTSDSTVSSVLNESPYAYSISENDADVNIKSSMKREYSVSEEASDSILNTKEYQEIIDIVNQRYNLTNKKTLSQKAIDRLAGSLLTKAKSKYDKGALTERLSALFDYMANSEELSWEDVMKSADPITYDDDGNIIPLSQRFDEGNEDIRYSSKRDVAYGRKKNYNKNSYYDEFNSLAMQWRYKADTEVGDLNIVNGKGGFALLEATDDGYVEIAKGSWKEMKELKAEYERAYTNITDSFYGNAESFRVEQRRNIRNMQPYENGRNDDGSRDRVGEKRRPNESSRSDEYSGFSDKEKSLKSTKRESSVSEDASDSILNTKEYQEIIDIVNQRYNLTDMKTLSQKAIDRLAGSLLTKAKSKYDKGALTERLSALFDYMANSEELSWEDVMKSAAEISHDILSDSSSLDRSMQMQYKDTLDYLKSLTIYISPELRAEIDSRYGSLENYRRMLGGKTKITVTDSSKVSLDSLWRELNELAPEMFDAETNSLDQAEELMNFFEITKPQHVNQYEYYWDMNENEVK